MNMQEANEQFGLSKHALQRLAASGLVETRRSDTKLTPVLMNREDIAQLAARYKEAMDENTARAVLRLSAAELHELADRGIVERAEEAVTAMMDTKATFRASSVNAVITAIKARAVPADPSRSIKDHLWKAARNLLPPVPWPAIIELILSGDIKIRSLREHGIEWRKCVAPIDVTAFETLVRLEQAKRPTMQGTWVTRSHAAHMLNYRGKLGVQTGPIRISREQARWSPHGL
jgi:hypothetical protein